MVSIACTGTCLELQNSDQIYTSMLFVSLMGNVAQLVFFLHN